IPEPFGKATVGRLHWPYGGTVEMNKKAAFPVLDPRQCGEEMLRCSAEVRRRWHSKTKDHSDS
ncbi:MAG: hypothetical protein QOD93_304, partial [Acetobacteraceae bacterium]|nr:hypothetical protein [Acetobacteraceae bacterium]